MEDSAFFRQIAAGVFEPQEATIGPWSAELQHGGPPCALLTNALRTYPSANDKQLAKLSIEFFGPIPVARCRVEIDVLRSGKRIELIQGRYLIGDKLAILAHAWRFASEPGTTPPVADRYKPPALPAPQPQIFFPGVTYFPYGEALEWRYVRGGYGTLGPATVWVRPRIPLIAGEPLDGVDALILVLDSANGVSAELDLRRWLFVPVDMMVSLTRAPRGPWVGMDAHTTVGSDGSGQSDSVVFDRDGVVGRSVHTLYVAPR